MILVTGGSGFLGRHLVRHLSAQGKQVRALYNTTPPSADLLALPGIAWQQGDLLDVFTVEEVMQDISDIYHCAGMVSFSPDAAEEMLHFNPESTANIVNEAVLRGIRKMVYVSSVAALGRSGKINHEISEEQEWGESRYNSAYGLSKYLAENEVWRGVGEGLNAVIVNPTVILGPGDWTKSSAQVINLVYKEFPFYTKGMNAWVDVRDVVTIMDNLMASDIEAERYIVSAGNHTFREVFTMMAHALCKKPPRYHATPFMTGIGWRLGALYSKLTGAKQVITRETATTAHGQSYYNNTKLLEALPTFAYRPIAETVQYMAAAYLQDKEKASK